MRVMSVDDRGQTLTVSERGGEVKGDAPGLTIWSGTSLGWVSHNFSCRVFWTRETLT